jgi:hypothetical protein
MPHYRVEINGHNFLINIDDRVAKHGFFTYRFVEADDPSDAEEIAVGALRQESRIRDTVLNLRTESDPPVMDVESVTEVAAEEVPAITPGVAWYDEEPKRWWQFWRR